MTQFVSTSRHCRDIHYKKCLEWDIAVTLHETLTLQLSSSDKIEPSTLEGLTMPKGSWGVLHLYETAATQEVSSPLRFSRPLIVVN